MANFKIRNLLSLIQKRYLKTSATLSHTSSPPTATTTSSSSSSSFTVQYLINTCGLPLQSALSASQKLQIDENNLQKLQSLLQYLKSHHFNDTHIAKLIEKRPAVLHCRVEKNLKPKFDFLIKNGFVGQLLPELIISNPRILRMNVDSHIKPSLELLKSVLDSNEKIVAALKRCSWLLTFEVKSAVQPNIDFLIKEGVPAGNVAKVILLQPRVIMQKHDRMVYAVNAVKNLGLQPETLMFTRAVRVMLSMSDATWNKKIDVLKSLGWSEKDVCEAFKREPFFLALSEEKIRIGMDFYVNTMKLGLQTIVLYPGFLSYSIDKRMRPRYNVLMVLESHNLIKREKTILQLLVMSEKKFLENYVIKYAEKVLGLLEIYKGSDTAEKIHT